MSEVMLRRAVISGNGRYRYVLQRQWGNGPTVNFVMLNPSIADANIDDPTIRRCVGFARTLGFGGLIVTNLFAYRATDPADLPADFYEAVGPNNEAYLRASIARASGVIVAWGAHPRARERSGAVRYHAVTNGRELFCLGTTKTGAPRHPLYVRADQPLEPWSP